MFTLLPEQQKKALNKEYSLRKFYIISIAVFFTVLAAFIFLLPSYISSRIDITNAQNRQMQIQKLENGTQSVSTEDAAKVKIETNLLTVASSTPLSVFIAEITNAKPNSIKLNHIAFEKKLNADPAATTIINLSGTAADRNTLILFSNNLKQLTDFKSVDLPIENLAADKNSLFTIYLTVK